jgi:hypothetical protein
MWFKEFHFCCYQFLILYNLVLELNTDLSILEMMLCFWMYIKKKTILLNSNNDSHEAIEVQKLRSYHVLLPNCGL